MPLFPRPYDKCMIGERIVALFAGVVGIAALHFDGDDVDWLVVVRAAGLWSRSIPLTWGREDGIGIQDSR